jgi:hypothetical protein
MNDYSPHKLAYEFKKKFGIKSECYDLKGYDEIIGKLKFLHNLKKL